MHATHSIETPIDRPVFVYGTLMPGREAWPRFRGHFRIVGSASAEGSLFDLPAGYPGYARGEGRVDGFLLELRGSEGLRALDHYEGYDPARPDWENLYFRILSEVRDWRGRPVSAWIYRMERNRAIGLGGRIWPGGLWSRVA